MRGGCSARAASVVNARSWRRIGRGRRRRVVSFVAAHKLFWAECRCSPGGFEAVAMVLLRGKVSWALSEGPGRAIRRNGPAASQTQLFARFPSVLQAASSICGSELAHTIGAYKAHTSSPAGTAQRIVNIYASLLAAWTSLSGCQRVELSSWGAHI